MDILCASTVPSAAPVSPSLNPAINRISNAILADMGITQMHIAYRLLPSARIRLENPVPVTAPKRMILI